RWAGLAGGSQLALRTYLACRSLRARGAGGSGQTDRATLAYGSARARRSFRAPRPLRSRRAGRADQRAVVDVRQHPLQHGAELIDALVQARLTAGDLRLDSVHGAAEQLRGLVAAQELFSVQVAVGERLPDPERRDPPRRPGCPVTFRHVAEVELAIRQPRYQVGTARADVDLRQQPVDQYRRLVAGKCAVAEERTIGE